MIDHVKEVKTDGDRTCVLLHVHRQTSSDRHGTVLASSEMLMSSEKYKISESLASGRGMGLGHSLPTSKGLSLDWSGIVPVARLGPPDRSAMKAEDRDKYSKVTIATFLLPGRCGRHTSALFFQRSMNRIPGCGPYDKPQKSGRCS